MEIGDRRRIGQRRIAHPDPNPVIALGDRIGLDLGAARNLLLAGNAGAAAVGAEAQPVIVALQLVADELAHGQRQMPVRAAIFHRHRRARFGAEEHDGLAQNGARQRLAADLGIGRGDVPVIAQEHGGSPCCRYYPSARPRGRGRLSFLPALAGRKDKRFRSRGKCERMRNNERHERNDRHERVASKQEGRRSAEKRTNRSRIDKRCGARPLSCLPTAGGPRPRTS